MWFISFLTSLFALAEARYIRRNRIEIDCEKLIFAQHLRISISLSVKHPLRYLVRQPRPVRQVNMLFIRRNIPNWKKQCRTTSLRVQRLSSIFDYNQCIEMQWIIVVAILPFSLAHCSRLYRRKMKSFEQASPLQPLIQDRSVYLRATNTWISPSEKKRRYVSVFDITVKTESFVRANALLVDSIFLCRVLEEFQTMASDTRFRIVGDIAIDIKMATGVKSKAKKIDLSYGTNKTTNLQNVAIIQSNQSLTPKRPYFLVDVQKSGKTKDWRADKETKSTF